MTVNEEHNFSRAELNRYSRHFLLQDFGVEAQQKLKHAKVLVIGAGGLGSPVLLYLAAAGVGTLGIADFDVVNDHNLQRQILFSVNDIETSKAETAKQKLLALNPHINVQVFNTKLSAENAMEIINDFDIIADGSDNFPTRYLVNDACVLLNKVNVYASVFRYEGQVSVFNYTNEQRLKGPNYRDLYPSPTAPGEVADCSEAGVLGVLPGIIGSMQALEVIKVITGIGEPLSGKLYIFNALDFESRIFSFEPRTDNPLTGTHPTITSLIDYEDFCGIKTNADSLKEVTPKQLAKWLSNGEDIQLIDVREPYEYDEINIGAQLIPLAQISNSQHLISHHKKVVVHCKSGARSAQAIKQLQSEFAFENLYNLNGGIIAYLEETDHFTQ